MPRFIQGFRDGVTQGAVNLDHVVFFGVIEGEENDSSKGWWLVEATMTNGDTVRVANFPYGPYAGYPGDSDGARQNAVRFLNEQLLGEPSRARPPQP